MTENLINRISFYLASGGLFNPELADHIAVRTLLFECREALANVATNDTSQERVDKTSESVHEPIGYLCENAVGHKYFRWKKPPSTFKPIPLYTAPQKTEYVAFMDTPHRPWVGLTKEERHEISMANRPYCADVMAAHEEELKRRNT